tara:strand:- start:12976 stop:14382 length:1407 start_codon:yes stop_codon:yes gene_type:complete
MGNQIKTLVLTKFLFFTTPKLRYMISRRNMLKGVMASGMGAALGSSFVPSVLGSIGNISGVTSKARRVVFFLQNNGFHTAACIPKGMKGSGSLSEATLPESIKPLEPYLDKMHIINGLHGLHTSPTHSAYFGALGGYPGGELRVPIAKTIDYTLSKLLPQTILPHLRIGMGDLSSMERQPTVAALSASAAGKPLYMHCNPNHLYQTLFGSIADGDVKKRYEAKSRIFEAVESVAAKGKSGLHENDLALYESYVDGFSDINDLRGKLSSYSEQLKKHQPEYTEKYLSPQYETDWHDALLDIGISSLKSGLTNTLTIASGRGDVWGSWEGLGIETTGHFLGHMGQEGNPIWHKIRNYNCRMLVKLMKSLESVPEGDGTMMDNTLIVYTSNNADKQHTDGSTWPFILLGNCGGQFKTGEFTQFSGSGKRPINALYATILHAIGAPCDRYNMSETTAHKYDSGIGPIEELLV